MSRGTHGAKGICGLEFHPILDITRIAQPIQFFSSTLVWVNGHKRVLVQPKNGHELYLSPEPNNVAWWINGQNK